MQTDLDRNRRPQSDPVAGAVAPARELYKIFYDNRSSGDLEVQIMELDSAKIGKEFLDAVLVAWGGQSHVDDLVFNMAQNRKGELMVTKKGLCIYALQVAERASRSLLALEVA